MSQTRFFLFFALFLIFSPFKEALARSYTNNNPSYLSALQDLDNGQTNKAKILVARSSDRILNEVLLLQLMAQPGNDYSFNELALFIIKHAHWPDLNGIRLIAEQKIPQGISPKQIINWFTTYPPLTDIGFTRYIDALNATGEEKKAIQLIRTRWIEKDFQKDDLSAFHSRYAPLLRLTDHHARLDRLLWDNKTSLAQNMFRYVDKKNKNLAQARMALYQNKGNLSKLINNVDPSLKNHPGLLYERLKWRRKKDQFNGALEILETAPQKLGNPNAWWEERHIMARRIIEKKDFKRAYNLVKNHGLSDDDGFDYLQAEFLSGWLALRYLHHSKNAEKHFDNIVKAASSPVSKARGYYWLGRAQEASKNMEKALRSYEAASSFNTTYYGQLAIAKLFAEPFILALPEPAIPSSIRNAFFSRDIIQATEKLERIGAYNSAKNFFVTATNEATQRVDFALLIELANTLERPDLTILAAKKAAQKGILLTGAAYPLLASSLPTPPDPAFIHALIRQESMFDPNAGSPVGARGLMQLMPMTAKDTARKLNISYNASRLTDPDYNLKLGTYFIQKQIDNFDGSLILALAGYNAGPRRAREWMETFGDPRTATVDPIDWIEMIPIYETRNYIQRILENLQFYRARLNGGQAPLMILEDLKR